MNTMGDVMSPVFGPLNTTLREKYLVHQLYAERIAQAARDAIAVVPEGTLAVRLSGARGKLIPLTVHTLQLTHATFANKAYRVADAYRPDAITLGVGYGKPYCALVPIPGITAPRWQEHFPRFHYQWDGKVATICVGETFRIGEATSFETGAQELVRLLGMYNPASAYVSLAQVAIDYPSGVWSTWASGVSAITAGRPQDVFIPAGMTL